MLDDPTAALDEETSRKVLGNLIAYCKEGNKTMVVICHDQKLTQEFWNIPSPWKGGRDMNNLAQINMTSFSIMYFLLFLVEILRKVCKIPQTKLLFIASFRMTVQLTLASLFWSIEWRTPAHFCWASTYLLCVCLLFLRIYRRPLG